MRRGTAGRASVARSPEQDEPGASGLVPDPALWQTTIGRRGASRGAERHFLVPPFGEWLRLERTGRPIVLGRDEGCDLRIQSPTVSRRHAELTFQGRPPRVHLRDLDTTNGTRVNGELVAGARRLVDRDVLRLGEVTAVYRLLAPGAQERDAPGLAPGLLDATVPLALDGRTRLRGFAGDVAVLPMADLLGRLTVLRATGTLVIDVDGVAGRARLEDGVLVEAAFSGREGGAAFRAIAGLRRGTLRFEPRTT